MGDFLNIIIDNLDEIDNEYFFYRDVNPYDRFNSYVKYFNMFNFKKLNRCKLSDAFNSNETFFYVISDLSNYMFMENGLRLKEVLMDYLKSYKNLYIIYLNEQESRNKENFLCLLNGIKKDNLPENQFILINNNSKLIDYKIESKSRINVFSTKYLGRWCVKNVINNLETEFNDDKKFLFMTHNKRLKPIRISLLCFLKKNHLLNETDWSLICDENMDIIKNYISIFFDFDDYINEINYFKKIGTQKSYYEKTINLIDYPFDPVFTNTYSNSYINITTESHFLSEDVHITEKSFKPFYFFQIPLIIASRHHIKKMKEIYELDFFEDLINIDYDDVVDNKKRFYMIMDEIIKLSKNKNKIIEFYKNNEQRFINNREKILQIMNKNEEIEFLKNI